MKSTKLTAALLAALTACSAAVWNGVPLPSAELTASAADTEALPDWVPADYSSALSFSRMYGETLVKEGYVCVLFRVQLGAQELEDDREQDFNPIREMKGDVLREVRRTVFRPEKAEDGTADVYRLAVYSIESAGAADVELDDTRNLLNPNLVTYSFAFNENKELTKQTYTPRDTGITEAPDWVPADYSSAEQLYGSCGSISETQMYGGAVKIAGDKKSVCVLYEVSLADDGEDYRMKIESSGNALGLIMSGTYKPSDRSASDKEYKIAVYCGMNEGQSCVLLDDGWIHNRPIAPVYYLSVDADRQFTDTTVKPMGISDLPDWVPKDYESALDFRNTYGTTRVQGSGVCVVSCERISDWDDESSGFRIYGYGEGLCEILQYSFQPEDNRENMFPHRIHVAYFEGAAAGEAGISFDAPGLDGLVKYYTYTFRVSDSLEVEETDIFSWMPDCNAEYTRFVTENGNVSVARHTAGGETESYVCVCLTENAGTAYTWYELESYNLTMVRSSNCSAVEVYPIAGGSVNTVRVYQPERIGMAAVRWGLCERTDSEAARKPQREISGSFYVPDRGAKTLLDQKEARFRLVDYYSGAPLDIDSILKNSADKTPKLSVWATLTRYAENGMPESELAEDIEFDLPVNPYICELEHRHASENIKSFMVGLDTAVLPSELELPPDGTEIVYYSNGAMDVTFRLKTRSVTGDVSGDGVFSVADAVLLSKWLLCDPDAALADWGAADFDRNGRLNAVDLVLMKRALMNEAPVHMLLTVSYSGTSVGGQFMGAGTRSELFPLAEGDAFYETMNGHWIRNPEGSDIQSEPLIRIKEIGADSVVFTFRQRSASGAELEEESVTVPYGMDNAERVRSSFIVMDGTNYSYTVRFLK